MFTSLKSIKKGFKRSSGRNNQGKITIRHRGGGNKRKLYIVDFYRNIKGTFIVCGFFQKSPNATSIALLKIPNQVSTYHLILNADSLKLGDKVINQTSADFLNFNVGSSYPLSIVPVGSHVHNIEVQPGFGGKLVRAAGCFGVVLQKSQHVYLKLPSGYTVSVSPKSRVSYGEVSSYKKFYSLSKAGQSRWFGKRPSVRGVAINAKDHPHGGGEGKGRLGRFPVSPWGSIIKGKK